MAIRVSPAPIFNEGIAHLSMARYDSAVTSLRSVRPESLGHPDQEWHLSDLMTRAELGRRVVDTQSSFIKTHHSSSAETVYHDVFAPVASRPHLMGVKEDLAGTTVPAIMDKLQDVSGDKGKVKQGLYIAMVEQIFNLRLHGGGGVLKVLVDKTFPKTAVSLISMDVGNGIDNFATNLSRSLENHAYLEENRDSSSPIDHNISGFGSFNLFSCSDEMTIASNGKVWTKLPSPSSERAAKIPLIIENESEGYESYYIARMRHRLEEITDRTPLFYSDDGSVTTGTCLALRWNLDLGQ